VSGEIGDQQPTAARLEGSRLVLPGDLVIAGNRFTATIPLLSSRWHGPRLTPPSSRYGLRIAGPAGQARLGAEYRRAPGDHRGRLLRELFRP
jgi:hypothetical protein